MPIRLIYPSTALVGCGVPTYGRSTIRIAGLTEVRSGGEYSTEKVSQQCIQVVERTTVHISVADVLGESVYTIHYFVCFVKCLGCFWLLLAKKVSFLSCF